MKRILSALLAVVLLLSIMLPAMPEADAAEKKTESRAIGIVFDNSGSMYIKQRKDWCRATYAMEVFASMLNKGDILQIYPMWPITVGGKEYTMDKPLEIKDAAQASTIREIYTPKADATPIESIDAAAKGLKAVKADKKYLIILTDGDIFYENDKALSTSATKTKLNERITTYASKEMPVMFLGIGEAATMPDTKESDVFKKEKASDTAAVLSTLTKMCNQIFGRDTMLKERIKGKTIDFHDLSMKKLIVFVQGTNIKDLKLTGNNVGKPVSSQQTVYSTKGAGGDYEGKCVPDTSLQGMMVTYENVKAGEYTLSYSGTATSVEVYYEPDVELDFEFRDESNKKVEDTTSLYEGTYNMFYGLRDRQTGELVKSPLLGKTSYTGSYTKQENDKETGFSNKNGEPTGNEKVVLKIGDILMAKLTVTYLSGYTISKTSADFGWPNGLKIIPRPAGDLEIKISGGQETYSLQDLEKGAPYIVEIYYQKQKLTGDELKKVEPKWDAETSNAKIEKKFAEDHWELSLHHKDPEAPENTACGECTVSITAKYTAKSSLEASAQKMLTYKIEDDATLFKMELFVPESYIVIKDLETSQPIIANLKLNGAPLTPEEFAAVDFQVDCGGINFTTTPNVEDSSYTIKLLPTEGIAEGNYQVKITATHKDHIGRPTTVEDGAQITLSAMPLWLKWLIGILALLVLFLIIWAILHIKVLPTKAHTTKKLTTMTFDGEEATTASPTAEILKSGARIQIRHNGRTFGLTMDAVPASDSYLYKSHKRRSAEIKPASVRKFGPVNIQAATIGSAPYEYDDETNKLIPKVPNQKPFVLKDGATIRFSGTINDAGVDKDFEVISRLNFSKKK